LRLGRLLLALAVAPFALAAAIVLTGSLATLLINDRLPPLDSLLDYKPRIPLRILTADGVLIGEFGEERRTFVRVQDVPEVMKNAIVAAEDARASAPRVGGGRDPLRRADLRAGRGAEPRRVLARLPEHAA
jgi:membrane carboxypeptidase/penicillin-binding protein